MSDGVIHVCVPADRNREVIAGSKLLACDFCGTPCWYDPQSCAEIPPFHSHGCLRCFPVEDQRPEDIAITAASVMRARHLRSRWN